MIRLSAVAAAALVLCSQSKAVTDDSVTSAPYPGAVALSQGSGGIWTYKSFPALLPLYIFHGEPAGRSICDSACTAVWPIVQAQPADKPVGLWSVVKREDGRFQWAYRSSPVYTYFEDRPNDPRGNGKNMDWYLDEQAIAYLASVGVKVTAPLVDPKAPKRKKAPQATAEPLKP